MIHRRLNDEWEHVRGSLGGIWEVWRKDKLNNHYNVPWNLVEMPHCFNGLDAMDPDIPYYQGPGWYRTYLELNNPYKNGRNLLHFEGAGQQTELFVYTQSIGEHIGGYDEFVMDITDAANGKLPEWYGDRVPLAIRCDNSRNLETIPSDVSDFNLYGGLYRYVNLLYVPLVSLESVHVLTTAKNKDTAELSIAAKLYNPTSIQMLHNLKIEIRDTTGQEIFITKICRPTWQGTQELTTLQIPEPKLWSPDSPSLYTCTVTLSVEEEETSRTERFGIRYYEFIRKGPFHLNGKCLLLRGTHRHEDHAGVGAAMTEEMIREEMRLIKRMGANFIRLGHYQQSRIVLDLCDELGLLVWEEIPWCRGGIGGEPYRKMCKDMLAAMIDQHRNHPSVILWGLGNENDWEADFEAFEEEEIREFMLELHQLAHELDPSRLTAIRRCEFCKDIVDVYSPSIWAGWYRGTYPEYESYSRIGFEHTDRFLHVEWGADNVAGRHVKKPYTGFEDIHAGKGADERDGDYLLSGGDPRVSSLGDWSETYFCDMIDWYLKEQIGMDWLTGTAQWSFKDFSTPVRPDSPIPYLNMKGVVERDFTLKEAYYVFQSYWTTDPMVRIYGNSMPVRWGTEIEPQLIKVYSNCPEVELVVNGRSCGTKTRNPQDFPCAGLRWEVTLEEGENHIAAIGHAGGAEWTTGAAGTAGLKRTTGAVKDEAVFHFQTEAWSTPSQLRLESKISVKGLVFLEVTAYDEAGIFCPDAAFFVKFGITGAGKLLDNLGTVKGSKYLQLANGHAQIGIDPHGGKSVASVSAEGMEPVFIEVI